ncbi:hypothetical protein F441_12475 [Phytophthora nicotianae CJ01A1]|uniref:Uncharacterized protein n=4 Tax=Phytophthora nicotianae TaxID=4792 RepID=V9ESU9_PHYNI|nr:hypothetical protein F443_12515 [Phytophthora nicotianae P1569]ETK82377.1 hypothetical protein L915_12226 [Phytophthora nicotianae]ETP12088.1 hypothetical protein F441_12475 [Phytophthora nicotianae CJ01A1]ETP40211.1 hypothetical protein F442_12426 [Phytophthora nicotianae P10297]ETL35767.1 hypothetical protein L916_12147 [Phytophthora nicotianae]
MSDTSKHNIWVMFYDPLGVASKIGVCQAKWISFALPLLQQWFDRVVGRGNFLNLQSSRRKIKRESKEATATETNTDITPQT